MLRLFQCAVGLNSLVNGEGIPTGGDCIDPKVHYGLGTEITSCTKDDFRADSSCYFECSEDFHSTNLEKSKTKITCTCADEGCQWVQKAEIECQGPCRHQTALFPKVAYFFKIIRDFSTSDAISENPTNSILVAATLKATIDTTHEDGWTFAIRFKNELPEVEAFSAQFEIDWNCNKNILYLRPREHNKIMKKGKFLRAMVLFTGITEDEMKMELVKEKGMQSLMWFNSFMGGNDANCLHYDFEYGRQFCDDAITTTTTEPTTTTQKPTTTRPTTGTTQPTTTTKGGKSNVSCNGEECTMTLADGSSFTGVSRGGVVEFRGVPYAEAPVGDLRWKAPVIRRSYNGESFDVRENAPGCASNNWDGSNADMSEDCLVVNINVAQSVLESGNTVPIVYYIHGGGFNAGNARISARNLINEQDVMVISIAYRLGIYGFLYMPETEEGQDYSGNWGILDQNAALDWAQGFAHHFGGDVSQATLNGCSAGSESIWWHLTTEKSWPFFNRAVTVGIGLNSAYEASLGEDLFDAVMKSADCNSMECLRNLDSEGIKSVSKVAKELVSHPIKLVLEPGFGPVVDGALLVDQLIISVRNGHLRKNTPISWNYAENDAWSFTGGSFRAIMKVPALKAQEREILELVRDTGFKVPSDYTDQWLEAVYGGEHLSEIMDVFGCSDSTLGETVDCQDTFSRFLTASSWACNSKWALNGVLLTEDNYGPIYPMQFQYRTCEPNESGEMTRSCHCSEGTYINGNHNLGSFKEDWQKEIAEAMRNAWGQFYREGTFPANTLHDYRSINGNFNVIDSEFRTENVFERECAVLDKVDNYLWDKMNF